MRRFLIAMAVIAAATTVGCTVPTPAEDPRWSEVCVPAETIRSQIFVTPIYVPESAWIDWNYWYEYGGPFPDGGVSRGTATDFVAGVAHQLPAIDPGRCLHIKPSPGLLFSIALVPFPIYTGPTAGWLPGECLGC
jgi:hypothetical protein